MDPSLILADSGQLIGVLLILAGAVGYLTIYYRRVLKGERDCGCGIPLGRKKHADKTTKADAPAGAGGQSSQQFLPAENLADLAARHRRERHDSEPPAHE